LIAFSATKGVRAGQAGTKGREGKKKYGPVHKLVRMAPDSFHTVQKVSKTKFIPHKPYIDEIQLKQYVF
jgi:hypothetical protein